MVHIIFVSTDRLTDRTITLPLLCMRVHGKTSILSGTLAAFSRNVEVTKEK